MLDVVGAVSLLVVPVFIAGAAGNYIGRAGHGWWLQTLTGFAMWFAALISIFLVIGATGAFDGAPSLVLGVLGALFSLPTLYALNKLRQLPRKPPKPGTRNEVIDPSLAQPTRGSTRAIRTGWELCRIAFEYEDAEGDWSSRKVTVHSVTRTYIKGECHQRRAERTFRLDRILSDVTDLDTGEILDVDVWAKSYR